MTRLPSTPPADPPALRSPLDAVHAALGASFTEFSGWRMPVSYSSDLAEHAAVRSAAGLFDLSHMAEIVLIGPEAGAALDAALADPTSGLEEGRAKYTLLQQADGGILDDLIVYRTGADRFLVVANAGNRRLVASELVARAAPFDVVVEDETGDIAHKDKSFADKIMFWKPGEPRSVAAASAGDNVPAPIDPVAEEAKIKALTGDKPVIIAREKKTKFKLPGL